MNLNITKKLLIDDAATNRKKLFAEALKSAKTGKVLYILSDELKELPQLSQENASLNRHYMKMISFLYAKDVDSLIESLCSLPDWQNIPSTIILDELNSYCDIQEDCTTANAIISLLIDSVSSCSQALQTPCTLLVSLTKGVVEEELCDVIKEVYFG